MKLISFVVPCYNSGSFMHKTINSLLLCGDKCEIIIINDGSTDNTGAVADSFMAKYPDIVKVVHQENGGHGAGIMSGLKKASGVFFKVVDSDDWIDEAVVASYLKHLSELKDTECDMVLTDYCYDYSGDFDIDVLSYDNAVEPHKLLTWDELGRFNVTQYPTIHSVTFRTSLLRDCGLKLPKHTFYEDNLYVYYPLPHVRKLYYMNEVLEHYFIGRPGQSMSESSMKRHYEDQIQVSKMLFEAYDLKKIKKEDPKLAKLMYRENVLMLTAASVFARLNKNRSSERDYKKMWRDVYKTDKRTVARIRLASYATLVTLPGPIGRSIALSNYKMMHRFLKFN